MTHRIARTMDMVFFFALYILGIVLLLVIGFAKAQLVNTPQAQIDIPSNCNGGMDLRITANCLHNELSSWWKYNLSNGDLFYKEKENINWGTIKESGGVCWHAAQWYYEQAKALGLNSKIEIISGKNFSHAFAIIWKEDLSEYCTLDQQMTPKCQKLDVGGLE